MIKYNKVYCSYLYSFPPLVNVSDYHPGVTEYKAGQKMSAAFTTHFLSLSRSVLFCSTFSLPDI